MSALYSCLKGKNDTIMATNQSDVTPPPENEEVPEECSGKKKSKFQAFKKFFVKKKRKESPAPSRESNLKPSQSSSDVSASGANTTALVPDHEPVAKGNMGNKAVSHDSVFISEVENSTKEDSSQENTPGKVKALQLQLQQNIRIGSPPQGIVQKKQDDSGALSEDDGLPRSPPEMSLLHEILAHSSSKSPKSAQRRSSLSSGGTGSEDEQESSELSSRPISPLPSSIFLRPTSPASHSLLVDFTTPASSVTCLDNAAAKHRIAVKPKKRKGPAVRQKRTKDNSGTSENLQTQERDETDRKVESQQQVSIPDSNATFTEQEASGGQVTSTEDVVLQKSEVEAAISVNVSEIDLSVMDKESCDTSVVFESTSFGKEMVSYQNEATSNETDSDFHDDLMSVGVKVDSAEEDTEREDNVALSQTSDPPPQHEQGDVQALVGPTEMDNAEVDASPVDDNQLMQDIVSENTMTDMEDSSVFKTDEALVNELPNEHDVILSCVMEEQNDLGGSDLEATETSMLQGNLLKLDLTHVDVNSDKDEEKGEFVTLTEQADAGPPEDEKQSSPEPSSEVADQLVIRVGDDESSVNQSASSEAKDEISEVNNSESSRDLSADANNKAAIVSHSISSLSVQLVSVVHNDGNVQPTGSVIEICKLTKPTDPNDDSKPKTSNKPVRFTVAPAWQRSFSVGSNNQDDARCKTTIGSTCRSESFDSTEEPVVSAAQENVKKNERSNEKLASHKLESSVAFGVRLRSTSSSVKYSEEHPGEINKQGSSLTNTVPSISALPLQSPQKTVQVSSDITKKQSKTVHTNEDRAQVKAKAEDLLPRENSAEPAWITMAKLKQRGFQEHPLAREQSVTNENGKDEKKNIVTNPQELEVKTSELTSTGSPALSEEVQLEPAKNTQAPQSQNTEEPPWFSLAKKKAKAWSEMPQIVQ